MAKAPETSSKSTDRPKARLLDQAWQIEAIEEGLAAAEAGEMVPHARVRAWLTSWGKEDERAPPL